MTESKISIIPFQDHHQAGIDALMASIAGEYEETFFSQLKSMKEVALFPGQHYWVACAGNTVVGTAGLCRLADNRIELKQLFLHQQSRGKDVFTKKSFPATRSCFANTKHRIYFTWLGEIPNFFLKALLKCCKEE